MSFLRTLVFGVLIIIFACSTPLVWAGISGTTYRYDTVAGIGPWTGGEMQAYDDLHDADMTVFSVGDLNDGVVSTTFYDPASVAFEDGDSAGSGQPQPRLIWDLGAEYSLGTVNIDALVGRPSGLWAPHDVVVSFSTDGTTWSAPTNFSDPFSNRLEAGYHTESTTLPVSIAAGAANARYVQMDFMSDYGTDSSDWWTCLSEVTFDESAVSPYITGTTYKYDVTNANGPQGTVYRDNLHDSNLEAFSTGDLNDGLTNEDFAASTVVLFEDGVSEGSGLPQPRMIWNLGTEYDLGSVILDEVVARGPGVYAPQSVSISTSQDGVNWSTATDFENPFPNEVGDSHLESVELDLTAVDGSSNAQYVMIEYWSDYGASFPDWFTGLSEVKFATQAVPEPSVVMLLLAGFASLCLWGRFEK